MFLAMGVGAYRRGIFHLYTHAFFKALLFLGSGAVIHALGGEQDLRRMGGLQEGAADHVLDVPDRRAGHRRRARPRRVLQQGRDPLQDLRERPHAALGRRPAHVAADRDLHVPAGVPGVPRRAAERSAQRPRDATTPGHGHGQPGSAPARRAAGDGAGARRAADRLGRWRATSACRTRSAGPIALEAFLAPSFDAWRRCAQDRRGGRRPLGRADDAEAAHEAERHRVELGADGAVVASSRRRASASRSFFFLKQRDAAADAWRERFARPAPRPARTSTTSTRSTTRRSCSRSRSCPRTGSGRASTPASSTAPSTASASVSAGLRWLLRRAADRLGARLRRVAPPRASSLILGYYLW